MTECNSELTGVMPGAFRHEHAASLPASVVGSSRALDGLRLTRQRRRLQAGMTLVEVLIVVSMGLGIWGGRVAGIASGILAPNVYDRGLLENFVSYNVFFALIKGYTFSFIISSIPAFYGYHVQGGSLEIGRASTKAVVVSCVAILFSDYILAALLLQ